MKTTLAFLTYNNITFFQKHFTQLSRITADEILYIDGGSTDGTRDFLREKELCVIAQEHPGTGVGVRTAMERSSGDVILFFIPDGSMDPEDIPILFEKMRHDCEMVIASRFTRGGKSGDAGSFFPLHTWVNRTAANLADYVFGENSCAEDTTNGFRALKMTTLRRLNPDEPGSGVFYQLTLRAMKLHIPVVEAATVEAGTRDIANPGKQIRSFFSFLKIFITEILNSYSFERKP